jgi:aminoglycoside phosphotransferase (APT) family kinase protein
MDGGITSRGDTLTMIAAKARPRTTLDPTRMTDDRIHAIFARHGIRDPWEALPATGLANRIYATREFVLRVATDHPDAVPDARTESVAAPVARAAGLPVPRLLAFDDSRAIVERPYSLWERVHGETLGICAPDPESAPEAWRAVGRQLAALHTRVTTCPDPLDWLDRPGRVTDLENRLAVLRSAHRLDADAAREMARQVDALRGVALGDTSRCFLHNDIHAMNVMCTADRALLAIIDWGDAGWGDPVLELAQVSSAAVPFVLEGYRSEAPALLGDAPEARITWDKLAQVVEELEANPSWRLTLDRLRRFVGARPVT